MPAKRPKPDLAKVNVRLDRDLLEEMRQAAAKQDRSLNSYIVATHRKQLRELGIETPDEKARKREGNRK